MEAERGTVDEFARKYPGMWLVVLLDEPGGRSGTLLVATASREEAGRVTMKYALKRRPVYFAQSPEETEDANA